MTCIQSSVACECYMYIGYRPWHAQDTIMTNNGYLAEFAEWSAMADIIGNINSTSERPLPLISQL